MSRAPRSVRSTTRSKVKSLALGSGAKFAVSAAGSKPAGKTSSAKTAVDAFPERGLTAFGERLVSALQAKGMSDSELAKALGIAQPNIHTLKYKTDRPRHKTVLKIAKVLGVSPDVLFPQSPALGAMTAATEGTKVYLVIEGKQGRQTIRLA